MEIRNGLEGLTSLLGIDGAAPAATQGKTGAADSSSLGADRATLSSAASEVAQSAGDDGVRAEKVSSIQAAVASGTYSVPASAVASKLVDAMLSGGR